MPYPQSVQHQGWVERRLHRSVRVGPRRRHIDRDGWLSGRRWKLRLSLSGRHRELRREYCVADQLSIREYAIVGLFLFPGNVYPVSVYGGPLKFHVPTAFLPVPGPPGTALPASTNLVVGTIKVDGSNTGDILWLDLGGQQGPNPTATLYLTAIANLKTGISGTLGFTSSLPPAVLSGCLGILPVALLRRVFPSLAT